MLHDSSRARLKVLLLVVVVIGAAAVLVWFIQRHKIPAATGGLRATSTTVVETSPAASLPTPSVQPADPTPAVATPTPEPIQPSATNPTLSDSFVGTMKLIIPVAGVRPDQLLDTFSDARSEGRVHDAIDIPAPAGTPVLAAADGEIVKLFQSERGGTTVYQLSTDKKLVYYYAHLQRYVDGLTVGKLVRQGEVIAYVGDTGNAGAGNYHLHFSIAAINDPKRYWEGTNINPYPLLRK
ncbi:MAG: peptidoglycan LD-endopeptidase LytH [Pyrinomonadaceae bacterium]|nr:peptidoglycan LD-endopeptidase LytH [Pyrinomonadaceae bacterium]